jgi:hypothetical protein
MLIYIFVYSGIINKNHFQDVWDVDSFRFIRATPATVVYATLGTETVTNIFDAQWRQEMIF